MALNHDDLWPRAGGWPALDSYDGDVGRSLCSAFRPGARRSRRPAPTQTPAAVRDALRRYSPTLMDRARSTSARCASPMPATSPSPTDPRARPPCATLVAAARRARATRDRARRRQLARPTRVAQGVGATRASSPSTRTSTCATASRTARRCGGSIEDGLDPRRIVQIGIADFANSVAYARRAADYGITVDRSRRRAAPRRRRGHGAGARGRGRRAAAASISTSTWTSATAPSRRGARRACRAASRRGSCARSCAPRHPMPGSRRADIVEVDATADAPDGRTVRLAALCVLELLAGLGTRT